MEDRDHDREVRAARNQALFRVVNEKLRDQNEAFATVSPVFAIACECADVTCTVVLEIDRQNYERVRRNPRWFAVLPGHIYPEVEDVVEEHDGFVVVEKIGVAAQVVEILAAETESLGDVEQAN